MTKHLKRQKPQAGSFFLAALLVLSWAAICRADDPTEASRPLPRTLKQASNWLSAKAQTMVRSSRRKMHDGTAAFPPQVGKGYRAFWLRDYAYMLDGSIEAFSDKELKNACRTFIAGIRKDGAAVDCVKFKGTPIYKPGYGSMGLNPVADGPPFTVAVVWHTFRRTKDLDLLRPCIGKLEKTMRCLPRNPKTGLVHIKPGKRQDRCPYGFTDTIPKQGDVLFCSLLFVEASRRMADLYEALGQTEDGRRWSDEAQRVAKNIRRVMWNPEWGLFRAATVKCNQPDIWGSAFAVSLGVADREQSLAIARVFQRDYDKLVQRGQVRHLPGGMYWEGTRYRDRYQNGGYWATPVGWFVYTLEMIDPKLADKTVLDMIADFEARGVNEWVLGEKTAIPTYLASVCLPIADIERVLARRAERSDDASCAPSAGK